MKVPCIAFLLIVFAGVCRSQQTSSETGAVCVLPNAEEPPTRISPGGEYNPATLTISIDKRPPVAWPHKQSVKIEKLSLSERHLIVLKSDGKRIQSFWFRFEKNDSRVCVAFDGYQGVQLRNSQGLSGANANEII